MRSRICAVLLAAACAITAARAAAQTAGAEGDWTAEDRAVIAAVLDDEMGDARLIVVADSTAVEPVDDEWPAWIHQWVRVGQASLKEALADYSARNHVAYAIPAGLPTRHPLRILPNREFERVEGPDRFKQLRAALPGITSYQSVSRPGYDAAHRIAVVYAVAVCEGLCGVEALVVLRRAENGWVVQGVAVLAGA